MIDIAGKLVNPALISSAEIESRFYMNGSATWLVVRLSNGEEVRKEHGFGFDAFAALERIRKATP